MNLVLMSWIRESKLPEAARQANAEQRRQPLPPALLGVGREGADAVAVVGHDDQERVVAAQRHCALQRLSEQRVKAWLKT